MKPKKNTGDKVILGENMNKSKEDNIHLPDFATFKTQYFSQQKWICWNAWIVKPNAVEEPEGEVLGADEHLWGGVGGAQQELSQPLLRDDTSQDERDRKQWKYELATKNGSQ